MNKKTKNALLGTGMVATAALPVVTAVSCGDNSNKTNNIINQGPAINNPYFENPPVTEVPVDEVESLTSSEIHTQSDWLAFLDSQGYDYAFKMRARDSIDWENHRVRPHAFEGVTLPDTFVLPDSVTDIGVSAFQGATLPEGFTLPIGLRYIWQDAFKGCEFNSEIELPEILSIRDGAFQDAIFNEDVSMVGVSVINPNTFSGAIFKKGFEISGQNLKKVMENAFAGAEFNEDFTLPQTVEVIGENAFGSIERDGRTVGANFAGDFIIPPSSQLTEIQDGAFSDAEFSESLDGLEIVDKVGGGIFHGATLPELPQLSSSVVETDPTRHWTEGNLAAGTTTIIYASATRIHNLDEFEEHKRESNIVIANDFKFVTVDQSGEHPVNVIEADQFAGMKFELGFQFPDNLANIGNNAFRGAIFGVPVGTTSTTDDMTGPTAQHADATADFEIKVNGAIGEGAFQNANFEQLDGKIIVPNTVTEIKPNAFTGITADSPFVIDSKSNLIIRQSAFNNANFRSTFSLEGAITSITSAAFQGVTLPNGFAIPNTVTSIAPDAFKDAIFNGEFDVPKSVTSIGNGAFNGAQFKQELRIGTVENNVLTTDARLSFGTSVFAGASFGSTFTIGEGITTIQQNAFASASLPSGFELPDSVTTIQDSAFLNAIFNGAFNLSNNITEIHESAFVGSTMKGNFTINSNASLEIMDEAFAEMTFETGSFAISGDMTTIHSGAFANTNLPTSFTIPSTVETIQEEAFKGATFNGNFSVPSGINLVGEGAFSGATTYGLLKINTNSQTELGPQIIKGLTYATRNGQTGSFQLGSGLTTIPETAFSYTNLPTGFAIPSSVRLIETQAFSHATFNSDFDIPNTVTQVQPLAFNAARMHGNLNVHQASGFTAADTSFDNINFDSGKGIIIDGTVRTISQGNSMAFDGSTSAKTIPNTVTTIAEDAYKNFINTDGTPIQINNDLVIPNSVTSIGAHAFENLHMNGDIIIHSNAQLEIGLEAFKGISFTAGHGIRIDGNMTTVQSGAFRDTELPVGFTLPNTVTTIEREAFWGASFLGDFTIPSSVVNLQTESFKSAVVKGNFTLNTNANTVIGDSAFKGMLWESQSSTFNIGSGITTIPTNAFRGTRLPQGFSLPSSVTSIQSNAFREATFMGDFTIPVTVRNIGTSAFNGSTMNGNFIVNTAQNANDIATNTIGEAPFINITYATGKTLTLRTTTGLIGSGLFKGTALPAGFVLDPSVRIISSNAFDGASFGSNFDIPNTVTSIGAAAFDNAQTNGHNFTIHSAAALQIGESAFKGIDYGAGSFALVGDITTIGDGAFKGTELPSGFALPGSVRTIGISAFESATFASSFVIPNSVNSILTHAFKGTTFAGNGLVIDSSSSLQLGGEVFQNAEYGSGTLVIHGGMTTIHNGAFQNTELPEGFNIPNSVTTIQDGAFASTIFSGNFEIPNSVTTIETHSFQNSRFKGGLNIVSNSALHIGLEAFIGGIFTDESSTATNFTISGAMTTIHEGAFKNTSLPTNFTLPNTVTVLQEEAFMRASFAGAVNLGGLFTMISPDAFKEAHFTGDLTINTATLLEIGAEAFRGTVFASTKNLIFTGNMTTVHSNAFRGTALPSGFELPDSVTTIQDNAFDAATFTGDFEISNHVTSIGTHAFQNVTIGTNVLTINSKADLSIGVEAFKGLVFSGAGNLILSGAITTIQNGAFKGTVLPAGFALPGSLQNISTSAFEGATFTRNANAGSGNEFNALIIPNTVTSIAVDAFKDSIFNGDVLINSNANLNMAKNAFSGTNGMKGLFRNVGAHQSTMIFGGNKTTIDDQMFSGAQLPAGFSITGTITVIDKNAFLGTNFAGSFAVPNHVTTINSDAFKDAVIIGGLTIPNTVTTIYGNAFNNTSLGGNLSIDSNANLELLSTSSDSGHAASQAPFATTRFNGNALSFGGAMTALSANAFKGMTVGNLILPTSLTSIGEHAFQNATITSINMSALTSLTTFGDYAFAGATLPQSFSLPTTLTSIGTSMFEGTNLSAATSLDFSNITTIGASAFKGARLPAMFNIASATSIAESAFENAIFNANTTGFAWPAGVHAIPNRAFAGVVLPNGFTIPDGVTAIGNYAFAGSTLPLASFALPTSGLTTIGEFAFDNAIHLNFTIPEGVTTIGMSAFGVDQTRSDLDRSMGPLMNSWPSSVPVIEEGMFSGRIFNNINPFHIPGSVTEIKGDAFAETKMPGFDLPATSITIRSYAFRNAYLPNIFSIATHEPSQAQFSLEANSFYGAHLPRSMWINAGFNTGGGGGLSFANVVFEGTQQSTDHITIKGLLSDSAQLGFPFYYDRGNNIFDTSSYIGQQGVVVSHF